jgi:hypothetical protein
VLAACRGLIIVERVLSDGTAESGNAEVGGVQAWGWELLLVLVAVDLRRRGLLLLLLKDAKGPVCCVLTGRLLLLSLLLLLLL